MKVADPVQGGGKADLESPFEGGSAVLLLEAVR